MTLEHRTNRMKRAIQTYAMIAVLSTAYVQLHAQWFSAGPDVTICSNTGALIGQEGQLVHPTWCIQWSPVEGLDDPKSARPKATPKNTTIYTVTVLDENWEHIATDDVKVTVGFGGIKFSPPFLQQGSDETSQATVTINPGNDEVTWSIIGEALECQIDSESGEITPGNEFGKITVRATKTSDEECFTEETIEINEGARDVTARDATHPGRIAKEDRDTLYLIGESTAIITAIPNAGGFTSGSPYWYDDGSGYSVVPADGQAVYMANLGSILAEEQHFSAGPEPNFKPRVVVIKQLPEEQVIDLAPIISAFTSKLDDLNEKLTAKLKKKFPELPSFDVSVNLGSFSYKRSNVEKYNDPGWGWKYEIVVGGSIGLSGQIHHPAFTKAFGIEEFGIAFGTDLYLEPFFDIGVSGSVSKDASSENPNWVFLNPVQASVGGGVRAVFEIFGSASGYTLFGGFQLQTSVGASFSFDLTNGELKGKLTINPLQGSTKVTLERFIDPKKKYTFFDHTVDLIDKIETPETIIFDFGAQN